MAGGSGSHVPSRSAASPSPQWSPGLMAGGSHTSTALYDQWTIGAAMEPRPDGRGKVV